ncbi:hypothetical protein ACLMJK_006742 [Lecanora helva]
MEPPYKRQRLAPGTIADPDLKTRRVKNDTRLKSIFESIFDKYSQNFEGIGDEIDLRTGEIVVDNGHIFGIRSHTDTGQVEDVAQSCESELSSDEEGAGYEINNDRGAILGDASLSEAESALQAMYVVNSVVEDAASYAAPRTFQNSLIEQTAEYHSEEDELADRTIEWITPREARAISHEKWQLPDNGPAFMDESTVEEAWRLPALPKSKPSHQVAEQDAPALDQAKQVALSFRSSLSSSPPTRGGTAKKSNTTGISTPILVETNSSINTFQNAKPTVARTRKCVPWTMEEEDQLRRIKTTTDLSYRKMEHLFLRRTKESIASKWNSMVNRDSKLDASTKQQQKAPSSLNSLASSSTFELTDKIVEQHTSGAQQQSNKETCLSINDSDATTANDHVSRKKHLHSKLGCHHKSRVDNLDAQDDATPSNPKKSGECVGTSSSSRELLRFKDFVAKRRAQLVENLDPECFEVFPNPAGRREKLADKLDPDVFDVLPPSGGSLRNDTMSESIVDTSAQNTVQSNPPNFQPRQTPILSNALNTERPNSATAASQCEIAAPQILFDNVQQATWQPESPSLVKALKRSRGAQVTSTGKNYRVQVVIPTSRPRQALDSAKQEIAIVEEESVSLGSPDALRSDQTSQLPPTPPSLNEGLIETDDDDPSPSNGRLFHYEIPDSQPASSSPLNMMDHVAKSTISDEQPSRVIQHMSISKPKKPEGHEAVKTAFGDDFVDELSMVDDPRTKQNRKSSGSLVGDMKSSSSLATLVHRPRPKSDRKLSRPAIADSPMPVATDHCDCSEDELSFM